MAMQAKTEGVNAHSNIAKVPESAQANAGCVPGRNQETPSRIDWQDLPDMTSGAILGDKRPLGALLMI